MESFKTITVEAIPAALEKAERYRLLNEPEQAESICRDILAVAPDHQQALIMLLLTLTDQFRSGSVDCFTQAKSLIDRLNGEYERLYYRGLVYERHGLAFAADGHLGGSAAAYDWMREAMDCFEQAERLRPAGNDDAILRWNSCLRLIERYQLRPEPEPAGEPVLSGE
jgi:tetratricopeptide (TPR) repeat protein